MDIVQTKLFDRSKQKQTTSLPNVRGADTAPYAFQWLLYKPQLHAIEPFQVNETARSGNIGRSIPSADGK